MEFRTTVFLEVYRVCCPDCGIKIEKVPQLPSKAPFSKRFEEAVGQACESASARQVARRFDLPASTVRAIDLRYLERWAAARRKPALAQMGVDEIYLGKKQKFITVVSNLGSGEPVWFGRERKKETLDGFFQEEISAGQRMRITAACVDMWEPYRLSIEQWAPNCRIVYDKFHVMQHASKAVDVALGVTGTGSKEVLGLWIEQTEGARFWHRVLTELQGRGVQDILIALIDGLTGFPEAITAVFPQTQIHTCVVHLVRRSLAYVGWQDRKRVAAALRAIYRAETGALAEAALAAFTASADGQRYPQIAPIWERAWPYVLAAFAYPPAIRRILSTTNAIENVHRQLRKIIKTRGHFPTDEAALKLLYLALRHIQTRWTTARQWTDALPHFALLFGDRFVPET